MSSEFAQGPPWPPEAAAAVLCHLTVVWNGRLGYHDAPDPGIRRVSGILGILATGFASNGAKGLLSENPAQLGIQAVMVRAAAVFAFVGRLLGSRMREQSFGA